MVDKKKKYNAIDIAQLLIKRTSTESNEQGELISNMKLQKMLYYLQGFHLAFFDCPLFEEEIEAWQYGPVVPSVYEEFKSNGSNGIKFNDDVELITLSDDQQQLFNTVYENYIQFSAYGLMNKTHDESPWKDTPTGKGNVITHDKMQRFFKTRIE